MLKRIALGLVLLIMGNILSIIHIVKKNPIKRILEPSSDCFQTGNPSVIFFVSELIEGMPNNIPMPFKCYERALTARFVFNMFKIKSVFYIGFNPKAAIRKDKLHAWLGTAVCDVCGFSIKDKYVVVKKYE
jgi:hypothetical protein